VEGRRTLIVGAGDAGEQLLRSVLKSGHSDYLPIGFVDDDPGKLGSQSKGLRYWVQESRFPNL